MPPPDAAVEHYLRQQRLAGAAIAGARSTWARLNPDLLDTSWSRFGPRLFALTVGIQTAAANDGVAYVPRVLDELEIDAPPAGRVATGRFVGVASDGRPLASLLQEPIIATKSLIGSGASTTEAMAGGWSVLERIIATQIADAGRAAVSVGIASRHRVGWVRMLSTPSCKRCAVLAGRFYRWNEGFDRHPRCDCRHIPATENVAGDFTTDPRKAIEAGQVTGLSKADTKAIVEAGADPAQVINATRKGAAVTTAGGLKATTSGTTRRGLAGKRLRASGEKVRLRPEAIYQQAATRDEAINLLRRHGYLI